MPKGSTGGKSGGGRAAGDERGEKKDHRNLSPAECCDLVWKHLEDVYDWQQKVYNKFWGPPGPGGGTPPPPPKWP